MIDTIEQNLLKYMEDKNSTTVLTNIVKGMNRGNLLAEQVKFGHIPFIRDEDCAVGEAIEIAVCELVRRLNAARDDLEVLTKTQKKNDGQPKYLNVRPITRLSTVS